MKRLAIIRQAAWLTMLAAGAAGAASPELRSMLEGEEVPPGLSIRAGAFRTDNIDRVPDQEEDERVNVFELLANWEYEGPRIDALLLGNASYRDYQDARFDNEWRGNLFAGANFAIVRDMFEWQLNGQFGNAVIDPLDTGGPDNVQRIDVLETGPIVRLRAGSADSFDIGVARAEVNAEVSQIDHSRDTANVQWTHEFSSRSNMGIFAGVSELSFDEGQDAEDYDRREAYLSWESSGNNRWYSLGAGRARIEFDSGVKHDATVGWLRASLRRTSSSRLYASFERRAGTTEDLLNDDLLRPQPVWNVTALANPHVANTFSIRYNRGFGAHEWSAGPYLRRVDYFSSIYDQKQHGLRLAFRFALSPSLGVALQATGAESEYTEVDREDSYREAGLDFDFRFSRQWSVVAGFSYLDNDSTDPAVDFTENVVTLFLSYSPGGRSPIRSAR